MSREFYAKKELYLTDVCENEVRPTALINVEPSTKSLGVCTACIGCERDGKPLNCLSSELESVYRGRGFNVVHQELVTAPTSTRPRKLYWVGGLRGRNCIDCTSRKLLVKIHK